MSPRSAALKPPSPAPASATSAVRACEARLTTAERTGDATALRALLAPDFVGVNFHGAKVTRAAFIASFRRPELRLTSLRIAALTVRIAGSTALVIGRSRFTGRIHGQPFQGRARFLDVWALRGKTWRLVASSVTRLAA